MRSGFQTFMLNEDGKAKARRMGEAFDQLMTELENLSGVAPETRSEGAREMAIVRTKLEEACFYSKKAMAIQARNQNQGPVAP